MSRPRARVLESHLSQSVINKRTARGFRRVLKVTLDDEPSISLRKVKKPPEPKSLPPRDDPDMLDMSVTQFTFVGPQVRLIISIRRH